MEITVLVEVIEVDELDKLRVDFVLLAELVIPVGDVVWLVLLDDVVAELVPLWELVAVVAEGVLVDDR